MRKINITIQIEDDDFREHELWTALDGLLGRSMIDYRVFPNTEHLKDNNTFKKLLKSKRDAGLELDRFINENRNN
jgi:hypothetical protein